VCRRYSATARRCASYPSAKRGTRLRPDRDRPVGSTAALIRAPAPDDAEAIAELLGVLGYPATPVEVRERLTRFDGIETATIAVAELDGRVVGLVTGHVFSAIHAGATVAWLTTLVVSDRFQNRGIGAQLTAVIEDWARQKGAVRVSLTSGLQRHEAHVFYEHLGFERTGVRLTKALNTT
jgi:GNAT superfamily N-acetyltransferase